jgi:hypothetical protein
MDQLHAQKHYRVNELAALWSLSRGTITRLFTNEPGVLRITSDSATLLGKRKLTVLSIPESIALRVHERLHQVPLPTVRLTKTPLRVVRLKENR